ncbi:hypothetical protein KQX54_018203 [Cotesia glomerata]|uniref:Uncharacterized protein n=1 Tax=Cotesia glomerata TaxID=32391 RepID=A0AAV7HZ91_COTGL|nr:hypothetical protein KQX54_018203 [Cotesia glomerata]
MMAPNRGVILELLSNAHAKRIKLIDCVLGIVQDRPEIYDMTMEMDPCRRGTRRLEKRKWYNFLKKEEQVEGVIYAEESEPTQD